MTLRAIIPCATDTYMDSINADTNYGSSAVMKVGTLAGSKPANVYRSLLTFDLSGYTGRSVLRAWPQVVVSTAAGSAQPCWIKGCTETWVEAQTTWNNITTFPLVAWGTAGGDFTNTDRVEFNLATATGARRLQDIGALCQTAIDGSGTLNIGIMRQLEGIGDTLTHMEIHSRNAANADDRPILILDLKRRSPRPICARPPARRPSGARRGVRVV